MSGCDRCGVDDLGRALQRARYRVALPSGHLELCNHHYGMHEEALAAFEVTAIEEGPDEAVRGITTRRPESQPVGR